MEYKDRTLACVQCGNSFTFSADDQAYHAQKGYTNEPKRCPSCRQAYREQRNSGGYSSSGGGSGYGRSERQLYAVVCASCGKDTEVPFQPRDGRPVYCRDCYEKVGGGSQRSSSNRRY